MANILIIDDDQIMCETLVDKVGRMGHEAAWASTLKSGLKQAHSGMFDVVFLDVRMPDGNGLDMLPKIKTAPSSPEVVIMTGDGDPDGAELAIKSGAWDYVEKPSSIEQMTLPIMRALQYREGRQAKKPTVALKREGIIGDSPEIRRCLDLLAQAASIESNVLITGETGTGKELFARAVHDNSLRASKNFVVVDCAALPETLVGSILFGHRKGAFTGADETREGLARQANGGTLFLDEVGELPLTVQRVFLRVLEDHRFRPVGDRREVESDFRLVGATNRNLDQMVEAGKFRSDLLFRLRSMVIDLPPLRKRKEDIKDLAVHCMNKFCGRYDTAPKDFSPEFLGLLTAYSWPGNVRELGHVMESALSGARNESTLFPVHVPDPVRIELARASMPISNSNRTGLDRSTRHSDSFPNMRIFLETTERKYLQDLVSFLNGNIREACRISGLSRSRLYARLKKYKVLLPISWSQIGENCGF